MVEVSSVTARSGAWRENALQRDAEVQSEVRHQVVVRKAPPAGVNVLTAICARFVVVAL